MASIGPSRRSRIEPFRVMEVLAAAERRRRTHGDLLSLAAGQPSTPAPRPVLEAARAALDTELFGYTEALGTAELRSVIAEHHSREYDIAVRSEDVVVTTGSSGAFTLLFLAAFDVGDTVVMARPGYPGYRNTLAALGVEVVELDCGPDTRYQPTVEMLAALDQPPAGLIVASPANPTGTIIDPAELASLARWCEDHGTLLISDEIYHGIAFGESRSRVASAWQTSRQTAVVGSVSKYFSMTGWRLGWMLVPEQLRDAVDRLTGNMTICPPAPAQHAAVAAFTARSRTELDGHVERYARNRELLLRGLPAMGIDRLAPADGAFYVYADIGHLTDDSLTWCTQMLDRTGVAMIPGVDFDTVAGKQTVRLSFAGATDEITQALTRLDDALN